MSSSTKSERSEKAKKKSKSTDDSSVDSTSTDDSKTDKNNDDKSKSSKNKKKKKKIKKKKSDVSSASVGSGSSYYYYYDSDSSLSSSDSEINLLSEEVKKKKFRRVMAKEASKSSLLDSASKRNSLNNNNRRQSLFSDDEDDSTNLEEDELSEFHMDLTFLKSSFHNQSYHTSDSVASSSGLHESSSTAATAPATVPTGSNAKKLKPGRVDSDDPDKQKSSTKSGHGKEKKYRRKKYESGEDTDSDDEPLVVFDWASIRTKSSGDSIEGGPLMPKRKKGPSTKKVKEGKEGTKKKKSNEGDERNSNGSGELKVRVEKHDWEAFSQGAVEEMKKKDKPKRNKNADKDKDSIKESKSSLGDENYDAGLPLDAQAIYNWNPKKTLKSPKRSKPKKDSITDGASPIAASVDPVDLSQSESKGSDGKNEEVSTPKAKKSTFAEKNGSRQMQKASTDQFSDTILPLTKFARANSLQEDSKMMARKMKLTQKLEKIRLRDAAASTSASTSTGSSSLDYNSDGENTAIHALTELTRLSISSENDGDKVETKIKTRQNAENTGEKQNATDADISTDTLPSAHLTSGDFHCGDENTAIHALTKLTRAISAPEGKSKSDNKLKTACKQKKANKNNATPEPAHPSASVPPLRSFEAFSEALTPTNDARALGKEQGCSEESTYSLPDTKPKNRETSGQTGEAIKGSKGSESGSVDTPKAEPPDIITSSKDAAQVLPQNSSQLGPLTDRNSSTVHGDISDRQGLGDEPDIESKGSSISTNSAMPPDVVLVSDASCGSKDSTRNDNQDQRKPLKIRTMSLSKSPKDRKKRSIAKGDVEAQHSSSAVKEEEDALSAYVNSILKRFTADPKEYTDESMIALLKEFPQAASMKFHLESSTFRRDKGKTRHYLLSLLCALGASRGVTEMCFKLHPEAIHKFDEHVGTPLHYTISYGILASFSREMWTDSIFETVEFLLEQEPRLLLSQHNHMRQTVLHQAILSLCPRPSEGHLASVKSIDEQQDLSGISDVVISLLLENDKSIATLADVKNMLPLHLAALCVVPLEIMQRLIKEHKSACTAKCSARGFTPLHYSVEAFAAAASGSPVRDEGTARSYPSLGVHVSNIRALLRENPTAAQMNDVNGDLPLSLLVSGFYGHYSFESEEVKRSDNPDSAFLKVIQLLCEAFPESVNSQGSHGKTPLKIVQKHKGNAAVVSCMTGAMLPESVAVESQSD